MEDKDYWLIGELKIPAKFFRFLVIIVMAIGFVAVVGCGYLIKVAWMI